MEDSVTLHNAEQNLINMLIRPFCPLLPQNFLLGCQSPCPLLPACPCLHATPCPFLPVSPHLFLKSLTPKISVLPCSILNQNHLDRSYKRQMRSLIIHFPWFWPWRGKEVIFPSHGDSSPLLFFDISKPKYRFLLQIIKYELGVSRIYRQRKWRKRQD